MINEIEQLENEIKKFRENIFASSELITAISELTDNTKKHNETINSSVKNMLERLDSYTNQFNTNYNNAIQSLDNNNKELVKEIENNFLVEQNKRVDELNNIKCEIKQYQDELTNNTNSIVKQLSDNSTEFITTIKNNLQQQQQFLSEKYQTIENNIDSQNNKFSNLIDEKLNNFTDLINKDIFDLKNVLDIDQKTRTSTYDQIQSNIENMNVDFNKHSDEILSQLASNTDKTINQLKECLDSVETGFVNKCKEIENIIIKQSELFSNIGEQQLAELSSTCNKYILETKNELQNERAVFEQTLIQAQQSLYNYQAYLIQQYNDFLSRLETIDIENLCKEILSLKQSSKIRFWILLTGIVITIILVIVSFFF